MANIAEFDDKLIGKKYELFIGINYIFSTKNKEYRFQDKNIKEEKK